MLAVAALAVSLKMWLSSPGGQRTIDTIVLRLPQIGRLTRNFATARICRLLGMLMEGYVPVLEALDLTVGSTTNCHYTELMTKARDAVTRGRPSVRSLPIRI